MGTRDGCPDYGDYSLDTLIDDQLVTTVREQPGVEAVGSIGRLATLIDDVGAPVFTVRDTGTGSHVRLVTISGRGPQADDEVELGPSTARDLDVDIGDTITLADGRPATVVGIGLFPTDVHSQFDEGAWVAPERLVGLGRSRERRDRERRGGDRGAVRQSRRPQWSDRCARIGTRSVGHRRVAGRHSGGTDKPLHNVGRLPNVLAAFLGPLGIVAVGHALFSSVRQRRRDFAVLPPARVTAAGRGRSWRRRVRPWRWWVS